MYFIAWSQTNMIDFVGDFARKLSDVNDVKNLRASHYLPRVMWLTTPLRVKDRSVQSHILSILNSDYGGRAFLQVAIFQK